MVWGLTILNTVAGMSNEVKLKARAKGRSVPAWLSVANDLAIMAMLASVGRFFAAGAVLWQICCEAAIYEGKD